MIAQRLAHSIAIVAVMIGIAAAAFWLPTLRYRDLFGEMVAVPPPEAPALRALARRECGVLLPIQTIAISSDAVWQSVSCRVPFGLSGGAFTVINGRPAYSELAPRQGLVPWTAFLLLEGAWGTLFYRTLRTP